MTVELGSWYIHLIYAAVFAFILAGMFIYADLKQQQYKRDVKGKIRAVIKRKTGWPLKVIVEPFSDGWVRADKGDYKLPDPDKQKAVFDKLEDEEKRILLGNNKLRV